MIERIGRLVGRALLPLFLLSLATTFFIALRLATAWLELSDPVRLGIEEANRLFRTGHVEEALQRYRALEGIASESWRAEIAYNLGTIHLSEAVRLWRTMGVWAYDDLLSHLHLAREQLKSALRLRPNWRDAQYQLELAFRIQPPPREREDQNQLSRKSSLASPKPGVLRGGP